ncbi:MAG TPA: efflux transporter outer membrane subunit [Steroidobacteraceae bacterium]|nr:efflux transporter outer membrane subunit [Steroidobacteraceae bacterium]
MRVRAPLLAIMLCGAADACSFAPRYAKPAVEKPPPAYLEADGWKQAQPADTQGRGPWWTAFGDPTLDSLETRVAAANQNIKAAFARLQQARAETRVARADYFPTLTVGPSATRSRTSVNSPLFTNTRPATFNDFLLDADLSYEIDVWGRVRNAVASARASEQASAADLATLDLSTHAELAADYFTLRGEDTQRELLDRTVDDYTKALELTQHLYDGGAAALADVDQARAQLETARTQATDARLRRVQTQHAIAVLIGESPSTFQLDPQPLKIDVLPPRVDPGLPSALLERRPDVAAAERRVAAANARIGVARAAYFPVFDLFGRGGFESTRTSNWITAPSRLWSVGPSALLTVFDGGRYRAQSAAAHAAYDEQVANYRNTVLTAYQEVEDNLAALRDLENESASQAAAVTATAGALSQAQYQYQGGIVTYLQVVATENAALSAQLAAADIQVRRLTAAVLLVKALGGGWHATEAAASGVPSAALTASP